MFFSRQTSLYVFAAVLATVMMVVAAAERTPENVGQELTEVLLQIGKSKEGKTVDWNDYPKGAFTLLKKNFLPTKISTENNQLRISLYAFLLEPFADTENSSRHIPVRG